MNMKVEYFIPSAFVHMPDAEKMHIVRPAETYQSIANLYDIDIEELKKLNNNKPLFIGKKITTR